MSETDNRPQSNVHLKGLIGVAVAAAALAAFLFALHLRRNELPVDPAELQLAADSPCMVHALGTLDHTPTYAELDRIKASCER